LAEKRSKMEQLLQGDEPPTRSMEMMQEAGERLNIDEMVVNELISPDEVVVFRIPSKTLGRVVIHWGCMSLHNNARGPYKGGIRISGDVTTWETIELSRLMTLKTAVNDVEFGGGKTGIRVDMPRMCETFGRKARDPEFERIIRVDAIEYFAQNFKEIFSSHRYIPAPDFGTGGNEMAVIFNQTMDPASVTGKPSGVHGWLPGRKEATGWGCFEASRLVMEEVFDGELEDCSIAVQGFGNVARWATRYLHERGCRVVAVTDSRGGAYDSGGLEIRSLIDHKERTGGVSGFSDDIGNESMFQLDVDILIPAALGDAITDRNAGKVGARAIVEGANMPVSCGGMETLKEKGVVVVPDIIANAGGVIASMEEYSGSLSAIKIDRKKVLSMISDRISTSFRDSMDLASSEGVTLADAAVQRAMERVYDAMKKRSFI